MCRTRCALKKGADKMIRCSFGTTWIDDQPESCTIASVFHWTFVGYNLLDGNADSIGKLSSRGWPTLMFAWEDGRLTNDAMGMRWHLNILRLGQVLHCDTGRSQSKRAR